MLVIAALRIYIREGITVKIRDDISVFIEGEFESMFVGV